MSPTAARTHVLGLDIGGTKLAAGIVDPSGAVRSFLGVPTRRDEGPEKVVERLLDLGRRAVDAAGYVLIARSLNRFRSDLGLRPVRRLFRWWLSPARVIGLFPDWYAAPQPDWPPQLRLAGFGRFDGFDAAPAQADRRSTRPPTAFS